MKIAFLFPGQGAQTVGMCKDIYEKYDEAKDVYDKASKILGYDVADLCFSSTQEELNQTVNTQIAILVTSLAICEVLKKYEIVPQIVTGLSLGEYTALIYGGYLSMEDGIKLVQRRGQIMQEYNSDKYVMEAVIGLDSQIIEDECKSLNGFATPANYNYSMQTVVTLEKDLAPLFEENLKQKGARKVVRLNTSGPFHTEKLKGASDKLKKELENTKFLTGDKNIKVLKNIDATEYSKDDNFADILSRHMISPVRMDKEIRRLDEAGTELYVEVGPGRALSGFVKKELKDKKVLNVENIENLDKLIEIVKE